MKYVLKDEVYIKWENKNRREETSSSKNKEKK